MSHWITSKEGHNFGCDISVRLSLKKKNLKPEYIRVRSETVLVSLTINGVKLGSLSRVELYHWNPQMHSGGIYPSSYKDLKQHSELRLEKISEYRLWIIPGFPCS